MKISFKKNISKLSLNFTQEEEVKISSNIIYLINKSIHNMKINKISLDIVVVERNYSMIIKIFMLLISLFIT